MHRLRRYDFFRFAQNDVAPDGRNDAFFVGGADGFRYANIPSLALSERAPYGFVWYVHPYPRVYRGANKVQLLSLVRGRAECVARAGSTAPAGPIEKGGSLAVPLTRREFRLWRIFSALPLTSELDPASVKIRTRFAHELCANKVRLQGFGKSLS